MTEKKIVATGFFPGSLRGERLKILQLIYGKSLTVIYRNDTEYGPRVPEFSELQVQAVVFPGANGALRIRTFEESAPQGRDSIVSLNENGYLRFSRT